MNIRFASSADYETWVVMREKLWPHASKEEHLAELKELEGNNFRSWIAYDENGDVGFVEIFIRPFANGCESRPVVFLEGIWVDERMQNLGVGKTLLNTVETWAQENGYKEIGSDADLENAVSHKAHLSWGFEETERVVYYRKKL